jgi:hypothetical protein
MPSTAVESSGRIESEFRLRHLVKVIAPKPENAFSEVEPTEFRERVLEFYA